MSVINIDRFTNEVADLTSASFFINIPDGCKLEKTVTSMVDIPQTIQKVDANGKLLYLDVNSVETIESVVNSMVNVTKEYTPIYTLVNEETGEMGITGYSQPVFDTDGKITGYTTVLVDGTYPVPVPIVTANVPVMIQTTVQTEVSTISTDLTVEEIIKAKFTFLTKQAACEYAYADEFINSDDIDLTVEGHSADTGVKIALVHPHGFFQLKPITLDVPAKTFNLYHESTLEVTLNGLPFINGVCTLSEVITEFVLKFSNNTEEVVMGKSYALMYNGGV